jgi:hypothetical protein
MDTKQIENILFRYPRINNCFIGVFSSDNISSKHAKFPYCFVANTAKSTESGEHWVAFFVPDASSVEYFDSYGSKPCVDSFKEFVKNFAKTTCNSIPLQGYSTMCGQYCVLFLIARQYGHPLESIVKRFHAGGNSFLRDISVCSIINCLTGLKLPLIDTALLPL